MNLYYLAKINNNRYKKQTRIFFISIILASILFLFFISISSASKSIINNLVDEDYEMKKISLSTHLSENISMADNPSDWILFPRTNIETEFIEIVSEMPETSKVSVRYKVRQNPEYTHLRRCKIGGYFNAYDVAFSSINGVDPKYSTFSNEELLGMKEEFGDIEYIIEGRDFESSDLKSVLIDEYFLWSLGINNFEEVLGQTIKIEIGENISIDEVKIVGVYNSKLGPAKYSSKPTRMGSPLYYANYFIVTKDVIETLSEQNDVGSNYEICQTEVIFEADTIFNVEEINKIITQSYPNNHVVSKLLYIQEMADFVDNVSIFFFIISITIFLIAFFSILNSLFSKIFSQKKFLRMLLIMGYSLKDIIKVYFIDNLITVFKAILVYVVFIYTVTMAIEYALKQAYLDLISNINNIFIIKFEYIFLYTIILIIFTSLIVIIVTKNQISKYVNSNKRG